MRYKITLLAIALAFISASTSAVSIAPNVAAQSSSGQAALPVMPWVIEEWFRQIFGNPFIVNASIRPVALPTNWQWLREMMDQINCPYWTVFD